MPELLQSKIARPRLRQATVARPQLAARLDAGLGSNLILVSAPAGYGKSTLVADWLTGRNGDLYVAWLALDSEDNDADRFVSYLEASLKRGAPPLRERLPVSLRSEHDNVRILDTGGEAFIALLNSLSALDRPLVIVLDDYHLITDSRIHRLMMALLYHLPEAVTVVLLTRMDPPLRLSRLRSQGSLTAIRASDLRFEEREAGVFLNSIMNLALEQEQVAALVARTEGWITGLQLAGLSLREHADAQAFLQEFAGDNHNIRSYLLDEVLAAQPPEIERFLLVTSVLERLTAPLCEAMLGDAERDLNGEDAHTNRTMTAQQILEYLEQHNLFVTPLDDHGQWYRYHTLFAALLRFRLWRAQAADIGAIQLRAAQWLEDHGLHEGASSMAPAEDGHAFARGVSGQLILRRGEHQGLAGWQEPLSERELDVLELLAQELSYQAIAERLFISLPTVKTHISHIYGKLGVHTRDEALVHAVRAGLLRR